MCLDVYVYVYKGMYIEMCIYMVHHQSGQYIGVFLCVCTNLDNITLKKDRGKQNYKYWISISRPPLIDV